MVARNTGKTPTFEAGCTTRIPQPFGLYAKEKLAENFLLSKLFKAV
jgi:hypothetical protein